MNSECVSMANEARHGQLYFPQPLSLYFLISHTLLKPCPGTIAGKKHYGRSKPSSLISESICFSPESWAPPHQICQLLITHTRGYKGQGSHSTRQAEVRCWDRRGNASWVKWYKLGLEIWPGLCQEDREESISERGNCIGKGKEW